MFKILRICYISYSEYFWVPIIMSGILLGLRTYEWDMILVTRQFKVTFERTTVYIKTFNLLFLFREWAMAMTTMQMLTGHQYFFSLLIVFGKWQDRWEISNIFPTYIVWIKYILKLKNKFSCSFRMKICVYV